MTTQQIVLSNLTAKQLKKRKSAKKPAEFPNHVMPINWKPTTSFLANPVIK